MSVVMLHGAHRPMPQFMQVGWDYDMPENRSVFILPERYSFDEDTTLRVFLHENVNAHVEITSQNLRRVDSLFIQYLIAAARKWEDSNLTFEITHLRAELSKSLELLGVQTNVLKWSAAE